MSSETNSEAPAAPLARNPKRLPTSVGQDLLRARQVQERLGGISAATLYRWVACGAVPKPLKVAGRSSFWRKSEIDSLVANLGNA